jgi:uncharacterized membrane protein
MRFSSIDALRTLSIFIMVLVHFTENLAGVTPAIAGLGAPMFMFLSGVSFRLWLNGRTAQSLPGDAITKIAVRRALFIFGLGFFFNIVVWLPEDVFNWDVLTLIGAALLGLGFFRHAPPHLLLLTCALLMILTPVLQQIVDWGAYWNDDYFDPDLTLSDVTLGFLVTGYFPVFPWLAFPWLGFALSTILFEGQADQVSPAKLRIVAWVGLMGLVVTALLMLVAYTAPSDSTWSRLLHWSMYPTTSVYLLGTVSWTIFAFAFAFEWLDLRLPPTQLPRLRRLAATFSRRSLTAYLLHHVVHLWPLWLLAAYQGLEPTHYWRQATSVPVAVLLAAIFLVICYRSFQWLNQSRRPAVEELMRWLTD